MNIDYSDRAKQTAADVELLQQATRRLKEILGPSQDLVRAQWDRGEDDEGRLLYALKISDSTGEAEATFAPDELPNRTHMRVRLARLWGELLQARNRKLMEALREPFDTEGN